MRGLRWIAPPLLLFAVASPARAEDQAAGLRAPPRSFALPMEVERDFGADNGDATFIRFLPPESQGALLWGAGLMLGIPTATADVLGSGKWAAGPALRLTWRSGPWNLGAVAGQRWTFAGDGPGITFHVGDHRWATSLQAYWNAIRPDGAPDWALRLQLIAAIPT